MKINRILLFLVTVFISSAAMAQLAVFQDDEDIITPSFKYDVLKVNRVATLSIQYEYKPDGAPIKDDGIVKFFRFDSIGRLSESYYTIKESRDNWDTIRTLYYYDDFSHLIIKRTNEGNFYDTWYYRWYVDGKMKKRAHVHEAQLATADNGVFRIGTQTVISADSFAYVPYPKQLQRYGYNEENTIYEKTITYLDDRQRMTSRNFHYAVGWLFSQVDLKYDDQGRIIEYTYSGNLNGDIHHKTLVTYDANGAIASQKLFDGDKETDNIEYMYDKSTGLISNQLDRDFVHSMINIARFTYEFR
jgi:antitoxin component YwqK of YwqJK toxin-antitoxin module